MATYFHKYGHVFPQVWPRIFLYVYYLYMAHTSFHMRGSTWIRHPQVWTSMATRLEQVWGVREFHKYGHVYSSIHVHIAHTCEISVAHVMPKLKLP